MATSTRVEPQSAEPGRPGSHSTIVFEYTGRTGLTVTGPVSGRRYRFVHPGAKLAVDPRDRPGLAKVPNLRQTT